MCVPLVLNIPCQSIMDHLRLWNSDSAILPIGHWLSMGYSEVYAESLHGMQLMLANSIIRIKFMRIKLLTTRMKEGKTDIGKGTYQKYIVTIRTPIGAASLMYHDSLLPVWKRFADAMQELSMCEGNVVPKLRLTIGNVELTDDVLNILAPALKDVVIESIILSNNNIQPAGITYVTHLLEANPTVESLYLHKNEIECKRDAGSLAKAVSKHPNLKTFQLGRCSINTLILPVFLPTMFNIKILDLDNNLLNDCDAALISDALQSNTCLMKLSLRCNSFTETGIKTLVRSVYDDETLNAIHDSNATCQLVLFKEGDVVPKGIDPLVLSLNRKGRVLPFDTSPVSTLIRCAKFENGHELFRIEGSRRVKILHAFQVGEAGLLNTQYLNDLPLNLIPKLLTYLQESGKWTGTEARNLDRMFQIISSMPEVVTHASGESVVCREHNTKEGVEVVIAVLYICKAVFILLSAFGCGWLVLFGK